MWAEWIDAARSWEKWCQFQQTRENTQNITALNGGVWKGQICRKIDQWKFAPYK